MIHLFARCNSRHGPVSSLEFSGRLLHTAWIGSKERALQGVFLNTSMMQWQYDQLAPTNKNWIRHIDLMVPTAQGRTKAWRDEAYQRNHSCEVGGSFDSISCCACLKPQFGFVLKQEISKFQLTFKNRPRPQAIYIPWIPMVYPVQAAGMLTPEGKKKATRGRSASNQDLSSCAGGL